MLELGGIFTTCYGNNRCHSGKEYYLSSYARFNTLSRVSMPAMKGLHAALKRCFAATFFFFPVSFEQQF